MTMIMITENLAMKININNLRIPLCRHYEIRKDRLSHLRRAIARARLHTRLKILRRVFFRSPKSN